MMIVFPEKSIVYRFFLVFRADKTWNCIKFHNKNVLLLEYFIFSPFLRCFHIVFHSNLPCVWYCESNFCGNSGRGILYFGKAQVTSSNFSLFWAVQKVDHTYCWKLKCSKHCNDRLFAAPKYHLRKNISKYRNTISGKNIVWWAHCTSWLLSTLTTSELVSVKRTRCGRGNTKGSFPWHHFLCPLAGVVVIVDNLCKGVCEKFE